MWEKKSSRAVGVVLPRHPFRSSIKWRGFRGYICIRRSDWRVSILFLHELEGPKVSVSHFGCVEVFARVCRVLFAPWPGDLSIWETTDLGISRSGKSPIWGSLDSGNHRSRDLSIRGTTDLGISRSGEPPIWGLSISQGSGIPQSTRISRRSRIEVKNLSRIGISPSEVDCNDNKKTGDRLWFSRVRNEREEGWSRGEHVAWRSYFIYMYVHTYTHI